MVRMGTAAVAVVALAAAACGNDSSSAPPAITDNDADLTVIGEDIGFSEDTYQVDAGTIDVAYRNEGSIRHTLVIDGIDGFELEVTGNGDEDQGTVDLEAGTYTIYCDVPGHQAAGMEATLEVR